MTKKIYLKCVDTIWENLLIFSEQPFNEKKKLQGYRAQFQNKDN